MDRTATIWVDADACPGPVREILFRAAERQRIGLVLVANAWLRTPPSPFIRSLQVAGGLDAADDAIVERVQQGDLVVTADIPLASQVIAKGAQVLEPRGELITADTIVARRTMRDFMADLRGAGVNTGGPPPLHARDRMAFGNALDRWLARRTRAAGSRQAP